jgi:hypothetical protein
MLQRKTVPHRARNHKPAKEKLEFSGNFFFIPYLLYRDRVPDRSDRIRSVHHYQFPIGVSGHRALLIGKWIAAQTVGRAFAYFPAARETMWSLT